MAGDLEIKRVILRKLAIHGYWSGRHTAFDNLQKGFPGHLKGLVKDAAEELVKEGLLIPKPAHYGLQVSLNPGMREKILEIIG
ncbi:MAG: hypothetical protein NTY90_04230 [Candidatus Micrarchaeota archaeon]|nr:hypothetical protein [Candidatus Micrarchaeota archaeon]